MPVDKIKVPHDPRISLRSAHLNGTTYGYLYSPASTAKRGTIFLVHGFPDLSMGWRYQIPFLTSLGLDVVAVDCIGYGRTDAPPFKTQDYTYRRAADDLAELARQLGLSQIILGGHDWGGAIVYRVAQYYPTLIQAVFSICTPYFAPSDKYEPLGILVQKRLPNFAYQLQFASGQIEEAVQSAAEIRQFLNAMYGGRSAAPDPKPVFDVDRGIDVARLSRVGKTKLLDDDEMDYYVAEYGRHGIHGPLNWYRNREDNFMNEWRDFFRSGQKPAAQAPTIKQEVLFVLATRDQALKPFMAERMGERIPNLTRREVSASHWALWERPEECNRLIGEWLHQKVFDKDSDRSRENKL
ncbi:hypothetical protein A1O1_00625 [Capronia coronata CBS 617.96]|uniref:AB hydrolase-1 domain-containing protein n=1 Tax=Capronia coronata CBS 617.96 TaxID=1182541 RepID=W9YSJ3_9EURO|nr:uncharacterized protein A1O1_00625 [Capronia coronata CBS 617.96]EXJ95503.1 hypothetical protein A1O1_00625 [Capronia coronata CBS 617.96]